MRADNGSWKLHLAGRNFLGLSTAAGIDYVLSCYETISLAQHPDIMSCLPRISHLTLTLRDYGALYQSTAWPRILPSLTGVTIHAQLAEMDLTRATFTADPIGAPVLESVELKIHAAAAESLQAIGYIAPIVRSFAVPRLADLVLLADPPDFLTQADLSCLAHLALRVSVRDFHGYSSVTVYANDVL
ncbi:hypothetical protein AURDEDRAFT_168106 [Auricularia subglabra TFB-10046 SS5]|nr:hypothetical protein AURDEDRAFT_168106 [Auricularia subglabra TFB-10046 SS5]